MTEATAPAAAPLTDPGPPPPAPEGLPTRRDRFFDWVRDFGMLRTNGWLGGVCAGIAARLRVDPLIVRGVFVVAALLGLPMLVVYAIAWALLPDAEDRIPFQSLLRGRFEPAIIGVLIVFLVGLVPVVPWGFSSLLFSGSVLLTLAATQTLIALLIIAAGIGIAFLLSRLARRAKTPRSTAAQRARAIPADAGTSAGAPRISGTGAPALFPAAAIDEQETQTDAAGAADAEPATAAASGPPPLFHTDTGRSENPETVTAEPIAPAYDAPDDEIAAWRAQHAAWKEQEAAWRRQQQDAERAAREQARREQQERAAAFAAEAAARRQARRASKPRASAAFVAMVMGVAVVAGAVVLLTQTDASVSPFLAPALGVLTAALITAAGMILAGVLRRRSGFLAFMAAVLLVSGLATAAPTLAQHVWLGDAQVTNYETSSTPQLITHPWGSLYVHLADTQRSTGVIVIEKPRGDTHIHLEAGVELELEATLGPEVTVYREHRTADGVMRTEVPREGRTHWGFLPDEGEPTTRQHVRITQESGTLTVYSYAPEDEAEEDAASDQEENR